MTWVAATALAIILGGMVFLSLHAASLRSRGRACFKETFGDNTWKCDTTKLRKEATTDEELATFNERPSKRRRSISFTDLSGVR